MPGDALAHLIRVLQNAYSGELAAGYAYRGHWRSLRDPAERERSRVIEAEEWHHRELVGGMLRQLGAAPNRKQKGRNSIWAVIIRNFFTDPRPSSLPLVADFVRA